MVALQARPLTLEDDIMPVLDFLRAQGMSPSDLIKVSLGPPTTVAVTPSSEGNVPSLLASCGTFVEKNCLISSSHHNVANRLDD